MSNEILLYDGGFDQIISDKERLLLQEKGIIYKCDECSADNGREEYHIHSWDYDWDDVNKILSEKQAELV